MLAERVGVKRESVSVWEHDKSAPESSKLLAIARALGVTNAEINEVAGRLLGRVGYFANIKVDPAVSAKLNEPVSRASAARTAAGPWPNSATVLASQLETRILEAGGAPESAAWARRALLNPDAYVRFYRGASPETSEKEILDQLEFMADGLFYAATGQRPGEGKSGNRPRRTARHK